MADSGARGSERPEGSEPDWKRLENLVAGMVVQINKMAQETREIKQDISAVVVQMGLVQKKMQAAVGEARQFTLEHDKRLQQDLSKEFKEELVAVRQHTEVVKSKVDGCLCPLVVDIECSMCGPWKDADGETVPLFLEDAAEQVESPVTSSNIEDKRLELHCRVMREDDVADATVAARGCQAVASICGGEVDEGAGEASSTLPPHVVMKLENLLMEDEDVFSRDAQDFGCMSLVQHSINTAGSLQMAPECVVVLQQRMEAMWRQLTSKVTHVVDIHALHVSPKPPKGLTKRHRGSAESIDLAQPKQSKISPGEHDRESSRDRSAMVAPTVSVQPSETPSVSDRGSCEDGLSMEMSDDIITAVPRGPTVAKSAVQPDPRPPVTGRNGDNSHHSPVGRKAAVQRPGTPQLPVSSRRLFISSQVSHGQTLQKARPSTAPK
ncbi:hypothetical protein E2C01_054253 [Portunus trituberculatus]|uniref:Uncharacterized protein n=1 Tax=Portunus trituberculatus TaxID=210409 RepID=A0A5B7GUI0_PORTR|nr:hypothetical protein [Portunus trituberculatus]